MKQYSKVFDGIGKLPGKYQLKVKENAIPVARTSRPIPVALRAATQKKPKGIREDGHHRESTYRNSI